MNKARNFLLGLSVLALLAVTMTAFIFANKPSPVFADSEAPIPETGGQVMPNLASMNDMELRKIELEELQNNSASGAMIQSQSTNSLVQSVRTGTEKYKDVAAAEADGHGMFLGCVSGQGGGAMGVHFPNGDLVGDPSLDPMHPEVLIYEVKNGKYELVGVEFLVLAEGWNAVNDSPPVLMGQVFNYSGSPNRYGLPAFYELHVWAWKTNPNGTFADWNPNVSCDGYEVSN